MINVYFTTLTDWKTPSIKMTNELFEMKYIGVLCLTLSIMFLSISALECGGPDIWRDQSALSAMLGSTEMRCGQLILTKHRLSCNVTTEEDERNLMCGGSGREPNCSMPISLCPDGSLSKTCFPVADTNSLHYICFCHSVLHHHVDSGITAKWGPWKLMDISYRQFNFTRKLSSDAVSGCLIQEYETDPGIIEIVNIISEYNLPDSIFSASSFYAANHEPYRARIDAYFSLCCAWAAKDYTMPWLQMFLPSSYVFMISGVLVKQRCDSSAQYVNDITVLTAASGNSGWQDVVRDIYIKNLYGGFDGHHSVTLWFPKTYSTYIWRVYVNSYTGHPSMKCDLKGYGLET